MSSLSNQICVCTGNHDPERRVECAYAERAAQKVIAAGWRPHVDAGRRYDLLRAVLSYVDTHPEADLPLTLLEAIRRAVAPEPCIAPPGNLCTDTGCWDADRCVLPAEPSGDVEARSL
ncbi:MAG: hypothetical protein HOV78_11510 [Hamadaea sp.]|nr:hypothetical protein [Hamadaea sp.]